MVEWENGEVTTELLAIIAADDLVSCAVYARDKNLLDLDEWKSFMGLPSTNRNCNASIKLSSNYSAWYLDLSTAARFQGILHMQSNSLMISVAIPSGWMLATALKLAQLHEYGTFQDHGYKKIWTHLVYDCKHDG
jgi:hypothetical protein